MTKKELQDMGVPIKFANSSLLSEPSYNAPVKNKFITRYRYGFNNNQTLCSTVGETKLQVDPSKIANDLNLLAGLLTKKYGNPNLVDDVLQEDQPLISGLLKGTLDVNNSNAERYRREWHYPTKGISKILLYPIAVKIENTTAIDFRNAPEHYPINMRGNKYYDLVEESIIEKEIEKNNYKAAVKIVVEYKFYNCQTVTQDSDTTRFLEDSQGL